MALDKARIVAEAVALLDADGLDGLTLRRLARRLGVQAPSLYWHVPSKAALVTAVADEILGGLAGQGPPARGERWQDWLVGIAIRLRQAMLAHPDGARVVSAAHLSQQLAGLEELAMSALVGCGLELRRARLLVLTIVAFTLGQVLSEQVPNPEREAAQTGFDLAAFSATHPTIVAAITEYFAGGRTADDLFRDCVALIVDADAPEPAD